MSYSDSEITRLLAELILRPGDRYKIRQEMKWLVDNATDLDEESRRYYRQTFKFDSTETEYRVQ